ncbi:hypothetical protein F8Z97_005139 [Escherichia coli]|nr:hypothetical protein [Escherichia coli]
MNERLKTHSKTQKKSADLVSNKLRIGVFQRYQMKCKSVSKKSPRYNERITERDHTVSPSAPVVLRWLREQHEGAPIRCLLLLSQTSVCHPRASVTVDEACSQVADLLQQTWPVISAGGQCRVERCFRVVRPDTSEQYVALKTAVQSLMPRGIATIIR